MNMISTIDVAEPAARVRRARLRRPLIAFSAIAVGLAGLGLATRNHAAPPAPPTPVVMVAAPLVRPVAEWDDFIGRFEPSRTVEIRPRISGQVVGVHFADGAFVRQGQLLFTIDPRPFAAALAEARANLAGARSDLALARSDYDRAQRLLPDNAISRSEAERLKARVEATAAALAAAEARVRERALDLEFTQVRAPIAGRISNRRVDSGNLVSASESGSGTLLTVINAVDPIYFSFDASEALFLKMKRAAASGAAPSAAEIRLQDEGDYRWHGRLDFTDNGLDAHSGTIRARAIVANAGRFLTPGMFGNMRLSTGGTSTALLVPDAAIGTDQARKIVLTVGRDGVVTAKPVELGPVVDGLRVVRSGLTPADRIVVAGIQSAMPGSKVVAHSGRIAPETPAAAPGVDLPPSAEATLAR
ncbi:MAG TPA: efflux RND transporter periplasmic adaptor subunit [Allosphingosinicella sp.]|jgi:RND family efflux transporter MFP subunit|nr:efflux RND transporter periplasmic adaptor subunit [Allosphingosinicella sp.]